MSFHFSSRTLAPIPWNTKETPVWFSNVQLSYYIIWHVPSYRRFDSPVWPWHGTAIGWHSSADSKITKIPVVSERFCGVVYQEAKTKLVAYTAYLPTSGRDDEFLETISQLTIDLLTNIEDRSRCAILIGLDSNQSEKSSSRRKKSMESFMTDFSLKSILLDDTPTFHHNNQISESQIDHILIYLPESCSDISVPFSEHLCKKENY